MFIKRVFNFHEKVGHTFSWFFVSSIVFITFSLLFVLDSFLGATYYIEFQKHLQIAALDNRVEYILEKEEYRIFLGKKAESLKYVSYLYSMLEENDFKAANRTLNVRKLPRLAIVDELKKKTQKLRSLDKELKKQKHIQETQESAVEEDIVFVFSPESSLKDKEEKIKILKEESVKLTRELLLIFSTVPPSKSQEAVYNNIKPLLKKYAGIEIKNFPYISGRRT